MIFNQTESEALRRLALEQAIDLLNPMQKILIYLVYQGHTVREIGTMFECSHTSILQQLKNIQNRVTSYA